MNLRSIVVAILFFVSTASYAAATPEALIIAGLDAYAKDGAKAALEKWIEGSAIDGSKEALSQANVLRQIQDFYGTFESHDIVRTHYITERVAITVLIINYKDGPVFSWFQTYKTAGSNWVVTGLKFHTDATIILPENIVFGE